MVGYPAPPPLRKHRLPLNLTCLDLWIFVSAGNGLCSLAELETFVLKSLLTKYPNAGKGKDLKTPGQDMFKSFRPCYIRAFKDAADYAKDDGETIKGTKGAKQDDYVSEEEFRLFCAYICIYATMVSQDQVFSILL